MLANCPGNIATDGAGAPICVDDEGAPLTWTPGAEFDPSSLDVVAMTAAFGAGFTIMGVAWAIGQGFKAILRMISS